VSILTSIKKLLGIDEEYTHFDTDIIVYINTALYELSLLGIGPVDGYTITDKDDVWTDFLDDGPIQESAKSYVYYSVRLVFDPPSTSFVIESINKIKTKLEWHLANEGG